MYLDYKPDDVDVQVTELLVASSDQSDGELPSEVGNVLRLLRERMGMDVIFVSQIADGRRTFKAVDSTPGFDVLQPGMSDPVEETWCQQVVEGRLPEVMQDAGPCIESGQVPAPTFPIGTHLSTPVRLPDGSVYGTVCCFSFKPTDSQGADIKRLRYTASLLAGILGEK